MNESQLITAAAGLILGLLALAAVAGRALRIRARVRRRLSSYTALAEAQRSQPQEATPKKGGHEASGNPLLSALDARYPLAGGVRAGLSGAAAGLAAFAVLMPIMAFFELQDAVALVFSAIAAAAVGRAVAGAQENAKRLQYRSQLLVSIENFQRMVQFGIPAAHALRSIAKQAEEPLGASLRNVARQMALGVPPSIALDNEARRVRILELAFMAMVLSTQERTGGNLSEAVGSLTTALRESLDNRVKAKSSAAEPRLTLVILSVVPVVAVGLQAATQSDMLDVLLNEGKHLLGIGVLMIAAGLTIAWLMIRSVQR